MLKIVNSDIFKISDNLHSSFSNYTNSKCTLIFATETTFAILGTHLWPLSVALSHHLYTFENYNLCPINIYNEKS